MAKKKKRRPPAKRRPKAPSRLQGTAQSAAPSSPGPSSPAPSSAQPVARDDRRQAAIRRREEATQRRRAEQRRRQIRTASIFAVVAVVVLGGIGTWVARSRGRSRSFDAIVSAAGCGAVKTFPATGASEHLETGQITTYDSTPPTHGQHANSALSARVYDKPFATDGTSSDPSVYQAVHSLEHGYVIVWHKGLEASELEALTKVVDGERKVIAVPYPQLTGGKMALTAWARSMTCRRADVAAIDAFVGRFRESRIAPEPNQP